MPDLQQKPRFTEGKDVIYQCRGAGWASWAMELLDLAYKSGCKLRKTSTHHVMISNDLGMTTTLAGRNSSNGARSRRDTMKVIDAQEEHKIRTAMNDPKTPESKTEPEPAPKPKPPVAFTPPPEPDLPEPATAPQFVCELEDPVRSYDSQAKLDAHRKRTHWQCPQCKDWLRNGKSAGGHVGIKHGKGRPWEAKKNFKGKQPAAGSVSELIDDLRRGPHVKPTVTLPPEPPRKNPNGTRKSGPTRTVVLPPVPVVTAQVGSAAWDHDTIRAIRGLLGEDPTIALLKVELAEWKRRAETAETKVQMMKDAAAQMSAAADL